MEKYVKVYRESGYVSANYNNIYINCEESIIIPCDNNEVSGQFHFPKQKKIINENDNINLH